MSTSTEQVKRYLQRNWFKLGIALVLAFIALKKDLSFRINLNTPVQMEQPQQQPSTPVERAEEPQSSERYTDNSLKQPVSELPGTDRFDFTRTGGSRREILSIDRLAQVEDSRIQAFLNRFGRVAASEQKKFGIPASVVLGNALLLSRSGTRELAQGESNNYFALPCTPDWRGAQITFDGKCYRQYENAWTSFRDHSLYITTGAYSQLRQLSSTDYPGWAAALEQAGFSGEQNWARQLVRAIEEYELTAWDKQ